MNEVLVVWMTWLDHNMTQEFPRVHNQQLHGRQKYQYIIYTVNKPAKKQIEEKMVACFLWLD